MTDNSNSTPVSPDTDDLNAFEDMFYGRTESSETSDAIPDKEEEVLEDVEDIEDDSLAKDNDSDEPDEDQEEEPVKPEPKKKNRFQERINDLTAQKREIERKYENDVVELRRELEALKSNKKQENHVVEKSGAPTPNDTNDHGEEKYPLGEFDPAYIRDLTIFTITQESTKQEQARALKESELAAAKAHEALTTEWNDRLEKARDTYEDLDEKAQDFFEAFDGFSGVDQKFAQYIAETIMMMDTGPDVLYYLANNHKEAKQLFSLNPARATLALGRLESKFLKSETDEPKKKVSNAPAPPPSSNKGVASSKSIRADTDSLDDFEKLFYNKKSK